MEFEPHRDLAAVVLGLLCMGAIIALSSRHKSNKFHVSKIKDDKKK